MACNLYLREWNDDLVAVKIGSTNRGFRYESYLTIEDMAFIKDNIDNLKKKLYNPKYNIRFVSGWYNSSHRLFLEIYVPDYGDQWVWRKARVEDFLTF